jgi:hypothetical protein
MEASSPALGCHSFGVCAEENSKESFMFKTATGYVDQTHFF